jgi:hypothetical protein
MIVQSGQKQDVLFLNVAMLFFMSSHLPRAMLSLPLKGKNTPLNLSSRGDIMALEKTIVHGSGYG